MYKIIVKNSLQNRKNQHLLANTIIKHQGPKENVMWLFFLKKKCIFI